MLHTCSAHGQTWANVLSFPPGGSNGPRLPAPDRKGTEPRVPMTAPLFGGHFILVRRVFWDYIKFYLKRVIRNATCMNCGLCHASSFYLCDTFAGKSLARLVQQMLWASVYQGLGAAQIWRWLRWLWPCSGRVVVGLWTRFSAEPPAVTNCYLLCHSTNFSLINPNEDFWRTPLESFRLEMSDLFFDLNASSLAHCSLQNPQLVPGVSSHGKVAWVNILTSSAKAVRYYEWAFGT